MPVLILDLTIWLLWQLTYCLLFMLVATIAWRTIEFLLGHLNQRPVSGRDAVLISGATSGIGLAVAKHLYKKGYSVIVGYYNSKEPGFAELKQWAGDRSIRRNPEQKLLFIELDVRKQESITRAYDECANHLLKDNDLQLYGLINNAGLGSLQPFAWLQRSTIKNMLDTNLTGTILLTREFLPLLIQSKGRILNVSSGLGLIPGASYTTYGVSKSGQIFFTRCLNMELSETRGVKSVALILYNFVKNTNICSSNVKNNEAAWEEMRPLERQLYEKEFNQHIKLAKELESTTKMHRELAEKKIRSGNNKSKETRGGITNLYTILRQCILQAVNRLKGESSALTLEETGVLNYFEAALRFKNPPEHIFAGDNFYNLLVGSYLLSWPSSIIALLSAASVKAQLYK